MAEPNIERKQISFGNLIARTDFEKSPMIPDDVKSILRKGEYYLFIFIPEEKNLKLNVFPVENQKIKKILIRLKEFSPDLVKGISDVLRSFNLGDSTVHTTGLCFSGVKCFYETYVDASKAEQSKISLDNIKAEFVKIPRVEEVELLNIEVKSL
jgi:hypothetical protein